MEKYSKGRTQSCVRAVISEREWPDVKDARQFNDIDSHKLIFMVEWNS